MMFNISYTFPLPLFVLLFILSVLSSFSSDFFFASWRRRDEKGGQGERERERFKKQLIGFLHCGCFIASGLNVNVIIIITIIRNVSWNTIEWMQNYHLPTCVTFPPSLLRWMLRLVHNNAALNGIGIKELLLWKEQRSVLIEKLAVRGSFAFPSIVQHSK